jgi:hypothetical protein
MDNLDLIFYEDFNLILIQVERHPVKRHPVKRHPVKRHPVKRHPIVSNAILIKIKSIPNAFGTKNLKSQIVHLFISRY